MAPLTQLRATTLVIIIGLVVSGVTAFPLKLELNILADFFVKNGDYDPASYAGLAYWIMQVREGLVNTYRDYPFIAYGTDWLAFGHIVIALFFLPVYRDPVRYRANFTVGMWACILVIPLALICGPIRGIPFYWQLIDCAFGFFCIFPILYAMHLVKKLPKYEA